MNVPNKDPGPQGAEGDKNPKVVAIGPKGKRQAARRRHRLLIWLTFVPCVVLPVIFATVYFGFFASDRYVVETRFAVRSPSGIAPTDIVGMMTGVTASGATVLDSYIIVDYLESAALVEDLERRMELRAVYDTPSADFLLRFDSDRSKEDLVDYFSWLHSAYFDSSSQVITVEVQAFTPEDAKNVAEQILRLCQDLVNDISEQARLDTVRTAQLEVERAEDRLREHRRILAQFRELQQDIDPAASAGAQQSLLGALEGKLATAKSELQAMLEFLTEDSPQVRIRKSEIQALTAQLEIQKQRLGNGAPDQIDGPDSLTARVGAYEELSVDLEFLQQAYVSAMASLEAARLEADRQQRYVAVFIKPSLPQDPAQPRRVLSTFLTLIGALMLWGLAVLTVSIIREHAA